MIIDRPRWFIWLAIALLTPLWLPMILWTWIQMAFEAGCAALATKAPNHA